MTEISSHNRVITAALIYSYMKCKHRVWRDVHGPQEERLTETNPFVQLLWDRGVLHELRIVEQIGAYEDMSQGSLQDRFDRTVAAMKKRVPQIYQGVLIYGNLLGIPDILRLEDGGQYVPVEIKSGRGLEGSEEQESDGKPKKTYAVQLALYAELLEQLGFAAERKGVVIDIDSNEVAYDLRQSMGPKTPMTYWELYQHVKEQVEMLLSNERSNLPALCGDCKLCAWHDSCHRWAESTDDLTGIFNLGRSKRDVITADIGIRTIQEAVGLDIESLVEKKNADKGFLKGIGAKTLEQIRMRANILKHVKAPVLHTRLDLPQVPTEVFFDIEDDPTQDFVYLHGVFERSERGTRYLHFTARELTEEAEKMAWMDFWSYIGGLPEGDYAVYYYAPHEKTTYRGMQKKYPDLISEDKVEQFFGNPNVIDLYTSVVSGHTDWPVGSYSIKALAAYIGFKWRDETPSGALSIQWFNEYLNSGDDKMLQRILEYNEDDCRATMVLKDKLQELSGKLVKG